MARINFKQFKNYTDITQERTDTIDVSRVIADLLYTRGTGIVMHDLALRIYRSEGEIVLNKEEEAVLMNAVERLCTPIFIDSIIANLINE